MHVKQTHKCESSEPQWQTFSDCVDSNANVTNGMRFRSYNFLDLVGRKRSACRPDKHIQHWSSELNSEIKVTQIISQVISLWHLVYWTNGHMNCLHQWAGVRINMIWCWSMMSQWKTINMIYWKNHADIFSQINGDRVGCSGLRKTGVTLRVQ